MPAIGELTYKPRIVELHKTFDFVAKGFILPREMEALKEEVRRSLG